MNTKKRGDLPHFEVVNLAGCHAFQAADVVKVGGPSENRAGQSSELVCPWVACGSNVTIC